jgi:hypothetical protein
LPTFTFCPRIWLLGAVLGRFMMVSITMAWLRLEWAFRAVNANTLKANAHALYQRQFFGSWGGAYFTRTL